MDGGNGNLARGLAHLLYLGNGKSLHGHNGSTTAVKLAVLEDGMRSYLSSIDWIRTEAEYWVMSAERRSALSFVGVCEVLGLEPDAVRAALQRLRSERVALKSAMVRSRSNGHHASR